jgi:phenylalanyl-tRNA synthetase beta chain
VDVPAGARELADRLAMCGFEVASVEAPPVPTADPDDAVIDFEITANRPDCLSVLGIAREAAAAFERPLREAPPFPDGAAAAGEEGAIAPSLEVILDSPELCPRYAAALAEVRVGPSPPWIVARLLAAGVRPINNVVDATNYVMLEMGHPMHAFDLDRLADRTLVIRTARPGERLRTLDGVERTLDESMLVIADARTAQAIAGVMGGADSEVAAGTRVIAIESAWFLPAGVRRTSRRLGLKTEASSRFERGADIAAPVAALDRVRALIGAIGAGRAAGGVIDRYPSPRQPVTVTLRHARIGHLLGQDVEPRVATGILERLGFELSAVPDAPAPAWRVAAPARRVDVAREVDLIEEVARHHGYDRLPTTFPRVAELSPPPDPRVERDRLVRRVLQAAGCSEAVCFAFIERPAAEAFASGAELVPLSNPLTEKFAVLRPSLLPGLIEAIGYNRRRERRDVRLFEIGSTFTVGAGERRAVALGWTGAGTPDHWSGRRRDVDFYDVKGVIERAFEALGVTASFEPADVAGLERGRAAVAVLDGADGSRERIAVLGQLSPAIADAHGLPPSDEVYVAELDLDRFDESVTRRDAILVQPPPKHPSVVRDLSILVNEALPAADVRGTIRAAAPDTLVSVFEFDRYHGKGVPEGQVSLSLRLTFRASDRTLTDAEVQQAMDAIVRAIERQHGGRQR